MVPSPSLSLPSLNMKEESKKPLDHDTISSRATNVETIETGLSLKSPSDAEKQLDGSADLTAEAELQYVTGIKLYLAVGSVSMMIFLILLDISIIATVSRRLTSSEKSLK